MDSYLVLLEPLFEELLATLLEHRAREFQTLQLVEFALLQKDAEVLKDGREASRL